MVPATSIYFEDNCNTVTYHTESDYEKLAQWEPVSDGETVSGPQDQDRPDQSLLEGLDADNIYGFDSTYTSSTALSNGSAHKVTAKRHTAVDANSDGKCDDCGVTVEFTHEWDPTKVTSSSNRCTVCLNTEDKHGDNIPAHTCTDVKNYNEYCDICSRYIGTHTASGRATFTFTGTGFDVVSLCSAKTGMVMVNIYRGEVKDWDDPNWDNYVTTFFVDTYYGYVYDTQNGKWVVNQEADPDFALYQVPVIKADLSKIMVVEDDPATENTDETVYKNFGYGTYSVEIYVSNSFLEWEQGYWETDFYLDGIRIYNPAGDGSGIYVTDEVVRNDKGEIVYDEYYQPVFKTEQIDNSAIYDIYQKDGEGWPIYQELRNLISKQDSLQDNPTSGLVFIDGNGTPTLEDYIGYGPNNELYLTKGKSVAFRLNALNYTKKLEDATLQDFDGSAVQSIHLGLRGLIGQGSVSIVDDKGNSLANTTLSTTDMYYDISNMVNNVVTITNTGDEPIAITNIKITHVASPYGASATGNGMLDGEELVTIDNTDAQLALDILTPKELVDPVVTPKYPALSFDGMVCYNVFFTAEDLGNLTSADLGLAVFDSNNPEGTVENAKDVILGATEIDGLYMVTTKGVHAKYLGDRQYFRAFARKADGSYVYSKMVSYSALDYANNVLAKSTDVKLQQLVVGMLNYGAEAQKFFGYNTDDLMNKNLTADQLALVEGFDASSLNAVGKVDASKVGAFASTGGFTKRYPAISFKGAFEINYFMAPANAVDGDMTLYFWNEDTYNSVTKLTAENADKAVAMTLENGLYSASSDEIIAKNLDKTLYVAAVYESDGITYCSGVLPYSIASYCQKPPADVAALANAAAIYGCTAKAFFGA